MLDHKQDGHDDPVSLAQFQMCSLNTWLKKRILRTNFDPLAMIWTNMVLVMVY